MRIVLCIVLCVGSIGISTAQRMGKKTYATVPQLLTAAGYPNEKHRAVTEDGYILQMHRIPAGRRAARKTSQHSKKGKRAILIVHGLLGSSGDFVIMGPKRSLAYMLADAGYDVWLGNLRGTMYSAHRNYTRNDPEFWEYSFHEHGKYDATAMIDKVLNVTGLPKVMYIGYSMGTTTFFTMMSERPEYNEKVLNFVGLAPAVYLDNIEPLVTMLLKNLRLTESLRAGGMLSVYFERDVLEFFVRSVCNMRTPRQDVCIQAVFMIVGEDFEQSDWEMNPVIMTRIQPASWRQLEHFGKIAMSGVFTSWEDGLWGEVRPYNLTNVKVPVTLLYGENDQLTDKSQIMRLARQLKASGVLESVTAGCEWPKFNHLDFAFARDVGNIFNEPLVRRVKELFDKYAPTDPNS